MSNYNCYISTYYCKEMCSTGIVAQDEELNLLEFVSNDIQGALNYTITPRRKR